MEPGDFALTVAILVGMVYSIEMFIYKRNLRDK